MLYIKEKIVVLSKKRIRVTKEGLIRNSIKQYVHLTSHKIGT